MLTKKEIRALPMPRISLETKTLALQNAEHDVFVITSGKVKNTTVINVFSKNEDGEVSLFYRYFVKRNDALLYNVRSNKITDGYLMNVFHYRDMVTAVEKEAEKLKRYISPESNSNSAGGIINSYDYQRSATRSKLRRDQKCLEIDSIMRKVRKVPKSFEKTIRKTMSHSSYIFYDRKNKSGTCSCCGSEMQLSELPHFKDRDSGRCPRCEEKIEFRSEARRQRYNIHDEGMAVLVQKYAHHVLIARYFHITYNYRTSQIPKVTAHEVIRTLIDYDKHQVCDYEWYYYNETLRWCLPQRSMFNSEGFHHCFLKGSLHKDGLTKELRTAGMDKFLQGWTQFNQFAGADSAKSCYMHIKYAEYLAKYPVVEPITKCGFYNLISDYMGGKQDMLSQLSTGEQSVIKILRLKNRTQLHESLDLNINSEELEIIQTYNETTNINRHVCDILKIAKEYEGREECAFALSDSRLRKLSNYIDSLNSKKSVRRNLICDYFDYLRNCEALHYVMNSDLVLYPKDFKKAHDKAAANVKSRKLKKEYKMIAKLLPDMHARYDFSNDSLLIKAPDSGRDIVYEGQILNHCVGGYVPQVAKGDTVILFIRRKNAPDKPYVTMEVRNDKIVQVRGFNNQTPEPEVSEFVKQYKRAKCIA